MAPLDRLRAALDWVWWAVPTPAGGRGFWWLGEVWLPFGVGLLSGFGFGQGFTRSARATYRRFVLEDSGNDGPHSSGVSRSFCGLSSGRPQGVPVSQNSFPSPRLERGCANSGGRLSFAPGAFQFVLSQGATFTPIGSGTVVQEGVRHSTACPREKFWVMIKPPLYRVGWRPGQADPQSFLIQGPGLYFGAGCFVGFRSTPLQCAPG